ncbi:MAG: nuclear transport factor 2 family protein [Gammaproteobacteria bacterium]|nr:nuclear transport factor 2 family protein [Gammaproteobacteria bacterium]
MRANIVQELALKYAQYVDDKAYDSMGNILAEDVEMGSPDFETHTLADFKEQLKFLDNFSATLHMIGNQLGEWEGEKYSGETYCVASHIYEKDGVPHKLEMGIRYKDTIAPMDGTYKYTRRYLDVVWQQDLPLELSRALAS